MFNKDNVFITVNEEVSSIIQQYIIREIKKVLDKYKSITTEEISSVEKLINSISNKEFGITDSDIFDSVRRSNRQYYNRTGNNALLI